VAVAFTTFLRRFPDVRELASADRADVLKAWSGLGYNRRAVALSEAARMVVREHGGKIPRDPEVLGRLPGVGFYTASAVASIAFGIPVPALDTNVRRVVSRFVLGVEAHEARPSLVRTAAQQLLDHSDPGRWNQAAMDLGREVCRPVPRCAECPLAGACRYLGAGRRGGRRPRRQGAFHGSFRQLRGAVVRELRADGRLTLRQLVMRTGRSQEDVIAAVSALHLEGLVRAGPPALKGNPAGRVQLG
jgi:adenine-specific DNA glycosylase